MNLRRAPHHAYHAVLTRRGTYVSFDRLGVPTECDHETMHMLIRRMLEAGLTRHVLLSQAVCWRSDYVAYGGRGYAWVATGLREELRALGVSGEQYREMTVENPRRALTGEA